MLTPNQILFLETYKDYLIKNHKENPQDYDWLYNQYIETNNDIEIIERELESCRTKQN